MCGFSYTPRWMAFMSLSVGFGEHLEDLLRIVVPAIRNPEFTEDIFKAERRQSIVDMSGMQQMQPYQHAMMALDTGILSAAVSGKSSVFDVNSLLIGLHLLLSSLRVTN